MQHIVLALFEANQGRVIIDDVLEYRPDGVVKFRGTDRQTYLVHVNDIILVPGAKLEPKRRTITNEES